MHYNFDIPIDRMGTASLKWEKQLKFGTKSGLLPYWIADTDFPTLPEAMDAIRARIEHPIIGYTFVEEKTLDSVRSWYQRRHNVNVGLEAYMASPGVVTTMWFSIRGLTQPGDKVMVFTPVYDPFFVAIRTQGREMVECPLLHVNNSYEIDWECVEDGFKNGVKALIFCNPHNPVGRVWTYDEVHRLVVMCEKYGVYLLSDEIHSDVTLYGHKYTSAACFADECSRLVVYTAISKTFNLAGLESSCCIIPNPEVKQKQGDAMRELWIMGFNALAAPAIEACYTYGDNYVDELNAYLTQNAELVRKTLNERAPEISVTNHEGTYLMWLDFTRMGMTSNEIVTSLAKEYGIAVGGGSVYGTGGEGFIRLNIGTAASTLKQGLDKIATFAEERRGIEK